MTSSFHCLVHGGLHDTKAHGTSVMPMSCIYVHLELALAFFLCKVAKLHTPLKGMLTIARFMHPLHLGRLLGLKFHGLQDPGESYFG